MNEVVIAAAGPAIAIFNSSLVICRRRTGPQVIRRCWPKWHRAGTDQRSDHGSIPDRRPGQNPRVRRGSRPVYWRASRLTINQVCGSGLKVTIWRRGDGALGDSDIVIAGGQGKHERHAAHSQQQPRNGNLHG